MTEMELQHLLDLCNFAFVYIVIQLGYAAIMSVPVIVVVLILRKVWPKKLIGLRILAFAPVFFIPFLARLKLYYEYKYLFRVLYPWYLLVGEHQYLAYVYVAVGLGIAIYFLRRRRKIKNYLKCGSSKVVQNEKVLVIPFNVGAFSFGIIHPEIVISENMLAECTEEELKTIIKHERTHIRRGHLIMLTLWNIFEVVYWINPLIHICLRFLKEDIEYNCDMEVLEDGVEPFNYGNILLKQMQLLSETCEGTVVSFAARNNYKTVKDRIVRITEFDLKSYKRKGVFLAIACLITLTGIVAIKFGSYPRYSYMDSLVVYDEEKGSMLISTEGEVEDVIQISSDTVTVDREKLKEILPAGSTETERLYLGFGGYMKLPGMGGAGECVCIESPNEQGIIEIPYESRDKEPDVVFLKWL